MRWTVLHARSRRAAASVAAVLAGAAALWGLDRLTGADGSSGPGPGALMPAWAVAAAAVGLSGHDAALDRTAATPWAPRRAAHLLVVGLFAAGVSAAFRAATGDPEPAATVIRDSAGLLGLAAVAATVFSGPFGWTLPLGWCAAALLVPPTTDLPAQVATWMLLPAGTPAAAWTALVLAAVGGAAHAWHGPRL